MSPSFFYLLCALCVAVLIFRRSAERQSEKDWVEGMAKMLASTCFLVIALVYGNSSHESFALISLALLLSWFGDLFLLQDSRIYFKWGLLAFLLAHLLYVGAFFRTAYLLECGLLVSILVLPLSLWVWFYFKDKIDGSLRTPVILYLATITAMVVIAISLSIKESQMLVGLAAVLFALSDVFVARERFLGPESVNAMIGLPLYYAAQLLFASHLLTSFG